MKTIENRNTNGRPPKRPVEKKKYKVTLKMATEEFYSLKAKARLAGITRSEYIRRLYRCEYRQAEAISRIDESPSPAKWYGQ